MAYFHCLIGGGSSGGGLTMTVTCDSQFAGTTITCTDGVTTLTQTCPSASPYEVEFEIPNGGDWTISGVVSGQTVTTGVNIPTTAELIAFIPQSITIYSAKEDTITYTDVFGDTQTEVFASGQSSKQITVYIEPSGSSITFTSGVAKDPTNLSNAYSKTVPITSNTTDVYLMPDAVKMVYWEGYNPNEFVATASATPSSLIIDGTWSSNTNDMSAAPTNASGANPYHVLANKTTNAINLTNATKLHWVRKDTATTIAHYELDLSTITDWKGARSATYLVLSAFKYDGTRWSYELDLTIDGNVNYTSPIYRWINPPTNNLINAATCNSHAIWYE